MSRIRLSIPKECRYSTASLQGKGVQYLKSEPGDMTVRLGLAIGAVFGPMGAALDGASEQEVEVMITKARLICEDFWAIARSQINLNCSDSPEKSENNTEDTYWDL